MKASHLARSALASLVAIVLAAPAARSQLVSESPEGVMRPSYALLRASLAARSSALQTSVAYDSQFVGHSHTDHSAGGLNPWNVYVGTCRPNTNRADNALWDFDNQVGLGTPDSLQGWWPVRMPYRYAPISTMTDDQRPWYCVDQGNQISYRPIMTRGRTFGVVSAWHADPGNAVGSVPWAPIAGAQSMWCGLRALNDVSVLDPVTHQPFNEQAALGHRIHRLRPVAEPVDQRENLVAADRAAHDGRLRGEIDVRQMDARITAQREFDQQGARGAAQAFNGQ